MTMSSACRAIAATGGIILGSTSAAHNLDSPLLRSSTLSILRRPNAAKCAPRAELAGQPTCIVSNMPPTIDLRGRLALGALRALRLN